MALGKSPILDLFKQRQFHLASHYDLVPPSINCLYEGPAEKCVVYLRHKCKHS